MRVETTGNTLLSESTPNLWPQDPHRLISINQELKGKLLSFPVTKGIMTEGEKKPKQTVNLEDKLQKFWN